MKIILNFCFKCKQILIFRNFSCARIKNESLNNSLSEHKLDLNKKKKLKKSEILWQGEREHFNKTYANGKTHVTAINTTTEERSIVCLSLPESLQKISKFIKQSNLPAELLGGLKNILKDCSQPSKVIQHNADQLSKKLENRRFPASPKEIRSARRIVMDEITETDVDVINQLKNPKNKTFIEKMIYNKAQKVLSHINYNWKYLNIKSKEEAATFALSRLSAYYAEMQRVLLEFDRNNFVPQTVLDYGSGIGAAFWAVNEKWGDNIKQYCLVDNNFHMRNISMDLMRGFNYKNSNDLINNNVYFRRNLNISFSNTYDMVILHRTLIEMPSHEVRMDLINQLWKRTNKYLVIVESPMSESFKALMQIRDYIITASSQFDFEFAKEELDKKNMLDMDMIHFLANNKISDYEKLCVVQDKLSDSFKIKTRLEPGFVFAPCPHDEGCPKLSKFLNFISPCKFKVRWTEKRADFKSQSIMRDGTVTGKFSYVIMEKGTRSTNQVEYSRILNKSKGHGCLTCTICTPSDGLQTFTISRRSKPIFHRIKSSNSGQVFPVDFKIVKASNETQFIRNLLIEKETSTKLIETKNITEKS